MPEVRYGLGRLRGTCDAIVQVLEIQTQAHRMSSDAYSSIPAIWRQIQRREHLVPALSADDRTPQLRVGPGSFPLEMRCVKSEADNVALHDPDCSGGVSPQVKSAHHITPIRGRRHDVLEFGVRPGTF
jgi:hypothetical protein